MADLVIDEPIDWKPYHSGTVTAADVKYVRDSWIASFYRSPWAGCIPNNHFHSVYSDAIDQLLARGAKLLLIRNPANPALLIAWVCYEVLPRGEITLHFAYTKATYRRSGAAKSLLEAVGIHPGTRWFYTFRTASSKFLSGGTHRPEVARRHSHRGPTSEG